MNEQEQSPQITEATNSEKAKAFLSETLSQLPWVGAELEQLLLDVERESEEKKVRVYLADRLVLVRRGIQNKQKTALGRGELGAMTAFDGTLNNAERVENKLRHGNYGIVGVIQATTSADALAHALDFLQVMDSQIQSLEELVGSEVVEYDWNSYLGSVEEHLASLEQSVRHREALIKGEV